MVKYKKLTLKDFGVKREERTLKNGCRVVLYEKKNSPLDINVKFHAGSRFDPVGKEGLAHFTEHMMVSGSENFKSKDLISMFLERYGGNFGLSTSNSFLSVSADIGEMTDVDILITFLNEIINKPLFSAKAFKTEKGSIINEIGDSRSSPQKIFWRDYFKNIYKNTPMDRDVLGTIETVKKISLKDVISFYNKNITSENCTIVASGDIKMEELVKRIERKIKFKNKKGENPINKKPYPLPRRGDSMIVPNETSKQTLLVIGFRVGSEFEYSSALRLLKIILAGGRASRLMKKLRYKKGLVYNVSADYDTYQDVGEFTIDATTSQENVDKVLKIIFSEIEDIKKNGVTREELDFVKDRISKSAKKNMQTSDDWVRSNVSNEVIVRDGKTVVDFINDTREVTSKDIIEVARKYLTKEKAFLGFCGSRKK